MSSQLRVDKIIPVDGVATGGGGGIVQVIQNSTSSEVSSTSTSYVDSGLTCTITPKFSTSKILIIVSQQFRVTRSTTRATGGFQILRGSTVIQTGPNNNTGSGAFGLDVEADGSGATTTAHLSRYNIMYLDSPNTTSSISYKTQMSLVSSSNSAQVRAQYQASGENGASYMTLMEVSA